MVEHILVAANENPSPGYVVGTVIGTLLIPGIGLLLLILGLQKRSRSRRAAMPGPGPYGYPQGPYGGAPLPYPETPYPGAAQPYPGAPYAGVPYPPPPVNRSGRSSGTTMIVLGIVILVLGSLVVVGNLARKVSDATISVGECITEETYTSRDLTPKAADCSDEDALYELASRGDGSANCPDGKRETSGYAALVSDDRTLCFALNAREGRCYHVVIEENSFTPVSCNSPRATLKIERRIDGSTDESECETGTRPVTFPKPARLYCVTSP